MSARDFLEASAKQKVTQAIEAIEAQTSAEVVVAVRKSSGIYRHADYLVGALFALAGLLVFLFHPAPFDEDLFPLAEVAFFLTGAALCAIIAPFRRLVAGRTLREKNAKVAAQAAFYEMGISRTKDRTGILVFVALFERRAEIVPDIGVDVSGLDADWGAATQALQGAVEQGSLEQFLEGLKRMGPSLGKLLPRSADDVNELSDEVR